MPDLSFHILGIEQEIVNVHGENAGSVVPGFRRKGGDDDFLERVVDFSQRADFLVCLAASY